MSGEKPRDAGDVISNFTIISRKPISEYRGEGIYLRHRTGALAYHLHNDDEENLFAFAFRTPSENSRGAAHIIEHSVLSGSRDFPIKDPFVALMKGSVNTFLNAMTYPDKTVYPASSTVEKDYFNLMRVYGDACFFPLLRDEIFHQEGRRYELTPDGKLQVVGVVYNEMLGNYGDIDSIVGEWSYRSLFPDSPYRFDSGGEPDDILDLTYDEFKRFHETYYHPANCLIFLYGNLDTEKQLSFIDENFLAHFEPRTGGVSIAKQSRWSAPRDFSIAAPLNDGEAAKGRSSITINWLTCDVRDPKALLSMEVLSEILLSNAGSPLQKTVVDSHLGEDLSPQSGLETDLQELVFTVGVRGTDPERRVDLEDLVLGELRRLVSDGIPEDVVLGALRRVEFRNREIPGGAPFGLRLMGKTLRGWLHGTEPETTLEFSRWMEEIKREVAAGPYFESFIRTHLLDNPHRATVTVTPEPGYTAQKQAELTERLAKQLSGYSATEREALVADATRFKAFQDTPDTPQNIARIPSLALSDIPRDVDRIASEKGTVGSIPVYTHDLFTNGVIYIDLAFDTRSVPAELLSALPMWSRAITGLGFHGVPYDEVARRLALRTGGVFAFLEAGGVPARPGAFGSFLFFRIKVLNEDLDHGVELLRRILWDTDFDDSARIRDLLFEMRNDLKSSIIPRGNSYAALRAGSRLSPVLAREEAWSGASQLLYLHGLTLKKNPESELSRLFKALSARVLVRDTLTLGVTAESDVVPRVHQALAALSANIPSAAAAAAETEVAVDGSGGKIESFSIPTEVGYASTVMPASYLTEPAHAGEVILAHLLRTEFLWERIRMRGGAYGAYAGANGSEGLFTFTSYRDPKAVDTLDVFREALTVGESSVPDRALLEKTIIGAIGRDLHPMSPGEKGLVGLRRALFEVTDEMRQAKRNALLSTRPEDIPPVARRLLDALPHGASVLFGGKKLLNQGRKHRDDIQEPVDLPL